ncbi:DUF932 domain-containing protein [bacterium]|nr:DUF932 domain-containing protein [bacterium]
MYFPVVEYPLFIKSRRNDSLLNVPSHKALVRSLDNGAPHVLSVVGAGYNVVQNKELFTAIEGQILHALSYRVLEGVAVSDRMSYRGRDCFRDYIFPNVKVEVDNRNHPVALRMLVWNSFGGGSFKLYVGAIDSFCTNGSIFGEYDIYYHKHTSGLKITDITKRVNSAVDVFYAQAETWKQWRRIEIRDGDVLKFLNAHFSERRASALMRQWAYESDRRGRNVWALYSALTYYSSHNKGEFAMRETGTDHQAATMVKREMEVRKVIGSDDWKALAA